MAANQYLKSLLTDMLADDRTTAYDRRCIRRTVRLLDGFIDDRPEDVGLMACKSQMDAMRYIADRDGGYVQVTAAVHELSAAGFSKAKFTSLYSNLWRLLDEADDFEWGQPGLYYRTTYGRRPPAPPRRRRQRLK